MLVLSRKAGQSIVIGEDVEISIVEVRGDSVRVAISAPRSVSIWRKELFDEISSANAAAAESRDSSAIADVARLLKK